MGLRWGAVDPGLLEDASAAFIVRVWIEAREIEGAPVTWRGSIEHVGSGEIRYVTEVGEIGRFVGVVLEGKGVKFLEPAG